MVGVREPGRLQDSALAAWLWTLDAAARRGEGVRAPLRAPPALLVAALGWEGAGLREAVMARLAVAAVAAKVGHLDVTLEHPTLVEAVLEAMLAADLACLSCLALRLGPRTPPGPHLAPALEAMTALTTLTLTPAATDQHLAALARAAPPLTTLNLNYCPAVTDVGVLALLGRPQHYHPLRDAVQGARVEGVDGNKGETGDGAGAKEGRSGPGVGTTLCQVNVWGSEVTTRGCLALLAGCPALTSLTCQWVGEALEVLSRAGRDKPLALTQLLLAETPLPHLNLLVTLCPQLTTLVVRWPTGPVSMVEVLLGAPALTALTLLQYFPEPGPQLPFQPRPTLTHLHLSLLEHRTINLASLAEGFPALTHLTLEGVTPTLPTPPYYPPSLPASSSSSSSAHSSPSFSPPPTPSRLCVLWPPPPPAPALQSLRLATPPTTAHVLAPQVAVWAAVWAQAASSLDLATCPALADIHLAQALAEGALTQVEDLRLTGAARVSDEGLNTLIDSCPCLRRLALKMLPRERLAQLETLKVDLRTRNLDLELITYGWKF